MVAGRVGSAKGVEGGKVVVGKGKVSLTRDDWLAASRHDWASYWLWPSIAAFVVCAFFMLAFHDKRPEDEEAPGEG